MANEWLTSWILLCSFWLTIGNFSDEYRGAPLSYRGDQRGISFVEKSQKRYFLFQPSGGFNNQRIIVQRAMMICKQLDRVCLVPMAGKHTSMYNNYNRIDKMGLWPMDRVLDFEVMRKYVDVVPLDTPFLSFIKGLPSDMKDEWFVLNQTKFEKRRNKVTMENITAWKSLEQRIVYFAGGSMWQRFDKNLEEQAAKFVQYTPFFTSLALDAVQGLKLGKYYIAVHARQSDHGEKWEAWMARKAAAAAAAAILEANSTVSSPENYTQAPGSESKYVHRKGFSTRYLQSEKGVEDPGAFLSTVMAFNERKYRMPQGILNTMYIATKPSTNHAYYNNLTADGRYVVKYSDDIPEPVITRLDELFKLPRQKSLRNDMLGVLEQLICARSFMFIGFKGSSFAEYISTLRQK
uniref:GDP-fucose protein O-fucosyltransferase 2 n=1 Tax=Mucochytrium quahogii TaxID=96639 RepID=A0A7S2WQ54_9STRA|mmetsp:Transcript_25338/g.40909  ORF Transcript_25338/g.40909 Transcript_25338/m.40909 type:complete len:406 (-) Transcript_25338:79-1296(-)